jgi:putative thioredoxin
MNSEFIVEVNESNFDYEVLAYSQQIPVVVDFWAKWCIPCRVLGPFLEKLTREANGSFRLAKVDVDQNQNLALRFSVRSIPAVKAFREGRIISEFTGNIPEVKIKEFIQTIAPVENDLNLEKGQSYLNSRQGLEATKVFLQILENNPTNSVASLGLLKSYLFQGMGKESLRIILNFPASREYQIAESLKPLAEAFIQIENTSQISQDPLDAAFVNSLRLVKRGNIEASLDGIIEILGQDKNFHDGEAKKDCLNLLELLGEENPITRQYRTELATILF